MRTLKTSIGMFEAFISYWMRNTDVIRPETVINQEIDENWNQFYKHLFQSTQADIL
jgi:hypothetical protein